MCVLLGWRGVCVLFLGDVVCVCCSLGCVVCVVLWDAWCVLFFGMRGVCVDIGWVKLN